MEASSPSLVRWGAAAACLCGISYGAAGYLDNPDASGFVIGVVMPVLRVTTPTLFLAGLVGLYSWLEGGGSLLQRAGLLVGLVGAVLGVFDGLYWWEGLNWWILLFAGLTAVGVGMIVKDTSGRHVRTSRSLGARVRYSRVGFLAHRPCLLWRSGTDETGPRHVRGLVLSELRGMGMGPFS
jgi:hypothetical protein